MYGWQSSPQHQQRQRTPLGWQHDAYAAQEQVGDEGGSRWGRRENDRGAYEGPLRGSGQYKGGERSGRGFSDERWENGARLAGDGRGVEQDKQEYDPRRPELVPLPHPPLAPPVTSFQQSNLPRGLVLNPAPPPPHLAVYSYRLPIPFHTLGSTLIGYGGKTQLNILCTAKLVRFGVEPKFCRYADFLGSREAIVRGLELVRWQVQQEASFRSRDFATFDERQLERVPGVWLDEYGFNRGQHAVSGSGEMSATNLGTRMPSLPPHQLPLPPAHSSSPPSSSFIPDNRTFLSDRAPPPHRQAYRFVRELPLRSLGDALYGPSGSTQEDFLQKTGLVGSNLVLTSQRHAILTLVGSEGSIRRALAFMKRTVYVDRWDSWNAFERDTLAQRGWVAFSWARCWPEKGLWLEERFSDPLPPRSSTSPSHAADLQPGSSDGFGGRASWPPRAEDGGRSLAYPREEREDCRYPRHRGRDERELEDDLSSTRGLKRRRSRSPSVDGACSHSSSFDEDRHYHSRQRRPSHWEENGDFAERRGKEPDERQSTKRRRASGRDGDGGSGRSGTTSKKREEEQEETVEEEAHSLAVAFPIPLASAQRFLHPSPAVVFIEDTTGSAITLVSQGSTSRLRVIAPNKEALEEAISLVERTVGMEEKGWRVPRAGDGEGERERGTDVEGGVLNGGENDGGGMAAEDDEEDKLRTLAFSSRSSYRERRPSAASTSSSSSNPSPRDYSDSPSFRPSTFSTDNGRRHFRSTAADTASNRSSTSPSPALPSAAPGQGGVKTRAGWIKAFDAEDKYKRAKDGGMR